ncbi:MAG: hypothetical protein ACSHX6_17230 [Akkermansiaceae bacterium]
MNIKYHYNLLLAVTVTTIAQAKPEVEDSWIIDSQEEWKNATADQSNLELKDGLAIPTAEKATFQSALKSFEKKRSAKSITLKQSTAWLNWSPIPNIGPKEAGNAPIFLRMGEDNYWLFGNYKKSKNSTPLESATLKGFDTPLMSTKNPHHFIAPGGVNPKKGGY